MTEASQEIETGCPIISDGSIVTFLSSRESIEDRLLNCNVIAFHTRNTSF